MRLILIRHGKAEDQVVFAKTGQDDTQRPLTREGRKLMRKGAKGLCRVCPKIDALVTSPLKRAVQTAEIIHRQYDQKPQFMELELLAPGGSATKLFAWIKAHDLDASTVALVGHEPDLGKWAGYFLAGHEKSIVVFKKGAACVIDFPQRLAAGKGVLYGHFQPSHLRKLS
jgi:phosphohistidine phosphatase